MHAETLDQLRERASALGVATGFRDGTGRWRDVGEDTLRTVLHAVSEDVLPDAPWPAVLVAHSGRPHPWRPPDGEPVHVVLESGDQRALPIVLPGDLPTGYHRVIGATGLSDLVVAPQRCYLPASLAEGGRAWGWAAQAYAVRSRTSWGIGDLSDLATLATDEALRGDFVLINPLNEPPASAHPGPYRPSSRVFRNPLYLDVEQVAERTALAGGSRNRFNELALAGRRLTGNRLIDRKAVHDIKDEALRLCYAALDQLPGRRSELNAWRTANPMVETFAVFRSLQGMYGDDWLSWPSEYKHPYGMAIDGLRIQRVDEVDYQAWLQWLLEAQLAAIPKTAVGIINDFPIGVARGGFDAWLFQGQMASQVTIGAPPDAFASRGQNWGLSALAPSKLTASGYRPFIQSIHAAMTGVGGLRIDHVMGLFRLFLIPAGAEPGQGTYVRYPAEDLLGIIALESQRAKALIVGEDLGDVGPGVRDRLAASNVLASQVVWFERDPGNQALPRRAIDYPRLAIAAVGTHDLATVAGVFSDSDVHHQRDLGLIPPERFQGALEANRRLKQDLLELLQHEGLLAESSPDVGLVTAALHTFLGRTPAMLVALRLEDVLQVHERPNMPGTTREQRPLNWRLPLPALLEEMRGDPRIQGLITTLRALIPEQHRDRFL
jgi:4-alpha-glucanotransferase